MFSIIMPAYNEEAHITEAIQSILQQSYKDIELLVVDDGSTDKTWEIISELSHSDDRLKVFHPGKLGKNGATNYAEERVSGDWFAFFGADDVMEQGILEKWHNIAEKYNPLDQKIVILSRMRMFATDKEYKKFDGIEIPKDKNGVCRSGGAFLATRAVMEDMFPLPLNYPNEDGWMKLYFEFLTEEIVPCPSVCVNYRIHGGNSIDKKAKYEDFTEKFHKRAVVCKTFSERYEDRLDDSVKATLNHKYELESFRYNHKSLKILCYKYASFSGKMRAFFFSNKLLYNVKVFFSKFFIGRN